MKLFTCQNCGQLAQFEDTACVRCAAPLGFVPDSMTLETLTQQADASLVAVPGDPSEAWRRCGNVETAGCNWLVPAGSNETFCQACGLNNTIPDLDQPGHLERWRAIEVAKRRLIYTLLRLRLPLTSRADDAERGLHFDFLADTREAPVMTGHADGLITINIVEADPVERERRRTSLGEPYRTLLGHMRHEAGHYYWDLLVHDGGKLEAARAVFGDERLDYGAALKIYYQNGAPANWQENYISAYATMHPWEDFAETWTHYLHMASTMDTAASFGMVTAPANDPRLGTSIDFDLYEAPDMDRLIEAWLRLTVALNSLSRSMGQSDLYPFALSPPAIEKLRFIHELVRSGATR